RAGARTLFGPDGTLPADVGRGKLDRRQLLDPGELFPHPAPPAASRLPQAADPDDAEIAAAPSALRVAGRGFCRRLDLPPRAVGRCRTRHRLDADAETRRRDPARGDVFG